MLIDMGCQPGISLCFSRIAEILRFLACNIDNPGFFIVRNLCIAATARSIKQGIFHTTVCILLKAKHYALTVDTDFVGYIVNGTTVCFKFRELQFWVGKGSPPPVRGKPLDWR